MRKGHRPAHNSLAVAQVARAAMVATAVGSEAPAVSPGGALAWWLLFSIIRGAILVDKGVASPEVAWAREPSRSRRPDIGTSGSNSLQQGRLLSSHEFSGRIAELRAAVEGLAVVGRAAAPAE